jgi:hypothetical protein
LTARAIKSQNRNMRRRCVVNWFVATTVFAEAITLWLRFDRGIEATEFNRTAPLLLQIHHMFWSVPLLVAMPLFRRQPRALETLLGISLGLVVSDLMHHFVVLPITG